jgi:hypothetical protein
MKLHSNAAAHSEAFRSPSPGCSLARTGSHGVGRKPFLRERGSAAGGRGAGFRPWLERVGHVPTRALSWKEQSSNRLPGTHVWRASETGPLTPSPNGLGGNAPTSNRCESLVVS